MKIIKYFVYVRTSNYNNYEINFQTFKLSNFQTFKLSVLVLFSITYVKASAQTPGVWTPITDPITTNPIGIATMPKVGIGTLTPDARTEIIYCPDENGLIVTKVDCDPFVATTDIDNQAGGFQMIGNGSEQGSTQVFNIPFNFNTFNISNSIFPLVTTSKPLFWARTKTLGSTLTPVSTIDNYNTKFIVMPTGKVGINVASPRASLDVRGQGGKDLPVAIFGNKALGTTSTNPINNLPQFYTQHIQIVPWLSENAYNQITQNNDQGIFFTDGKGTDGCNQDGAFVIAPWSPPNTGTNIGGLRIKSNGSGELYGNLDVFGDIKAYHLTVKSFSWPDYVFESSYKPMTLNQIDSFIKINKHLPDVPSATEINTNGIDVTKMQEILLKKIEELTLLAIEQQRAIDLLNKELLKHKCHE